MSMKTTAAQRQESSVSGDAIWRHYIESELKQTRQWEQNFSYLMNDKDKIDVEALMREDQRKLQAASTKDRKAQSKPFFSELSMLPEEPHRRDASSRSRFLYQQSKGRKIPQSKRVRDQEIKLAVPPHMHDPVNPKESSKKFNGPKRSKEVHSSFANRTSSPEVESIIARFRAAQAERSPHRSSLVSNLPQANGMTQHRAAQNTQRRRPRMGEDYLELDKRLPQQKFQGPQTMAQEVGWDPRNLEVFGVASHGLKKTDVK
uniref:Uncharacterized protein n=1 Tax=Percolomonas cosmopolitus TaxID=63605 RepID=A0A7S1KSJ8_9EUKA|mmetsp:Transcript_7666/g.28728  ORF Transcript_7666/g.28728 Transcript_7666/m.28728 type:complete len:260 (+) Transcript_7666:155-934(+)|eukprot:CAMPEP_0117435980 /NCGR_PEP_ID=MMETSP0759-20121206/772_1 /TAXON_ID=63605 /ORGANISM="Percolomonas cosmopolitus, Strain WS" /LENGTH=259 /DNA_ID=CAMNT_0005227567 /DNA_START=159 /DNA_END=938 /DNA_ORIENTATION=-